MNSLEYKATLCDYRLEGREEGRAEGKAEGIRETAQKMKADGLSAEKIAAYTGLSAEEISKL